MPRDLKGPIDTASAARQTASLAKELGLVPVPSRIAKAEGSVTPGVVTSVRAEGLPEGMRASAQLLADWLSAVLGRRLPVTHAATGAASNGSPQPGPETLRVAFAAPEELGADSPGPSGPIAAHLGSEAYALSVRDDGITIRAGTAAGLARAAATLCQLFSAGSAAIPCLEIEDAPRFGWRGFMLDCARHFFPVDFVERMVDLAARHKLNVFHWHLTDDQAWRLDLPGLPELAARGGWRQDARTTAVRWYGGSYGADEVRRVIAFAAARGVVVVPEIETPGHATALLASHPELSCRWGQSGEAFAPVDRFGVFEDVMCAGKETTHALLARIFEETAGLFDSPIVHAGGDEVPKNRWLLCHDCREAMRRERLRDECGALDPEALQAWFMKRNAAALSSLGRRMAGWDELADCGVPKDTVIFAWRGHDRGAFAARAGYDVVMCPQTKACYLDHKHREDSDEPGQLGVCSVADAYAFEPLPEGLSPADEKRIIGGQANLWSELLPFGRHAEYMAFPRLCAIAEALWSPRPLRSLPDFRARMETHGRRLDSLGVNRYRGPWE